MQVTANGIDIEYETYGHADDPTLLFIAGLGSQLITWDPEFLQTFVAEGLHVVVFDNRDVGKSTWFDQRGKADFTKALMGEAPYSLDDMADDSIALLDVLHIDAAHVIGISLGGMIAQVMAVKYPQRVLSLVSLMSTTGDLTVGQSSEAAGKQLTKSAPADRDGYIEANWQRYQISGVSPGYPATEESVKAKAARAYDRAYHAEGNGRQLAAVLKSGDRTGDLANVKAPTVVIHGADDVLIDKSGAVATANAIPDAELVIIEGMGHSMPKGVWPQIHDATLRAISRA